MTAFDDTFNSQFFDTDTLAVSAAYTPSGGDPSTVSVVFFNEGMTVELSGGVTVLKRPIALVRNSDISAAKQNETLLISETTYYIIKSTPDGEGVTMLELSENSV